jgi:hypothetical protein
MPLFWPARPWPAVEKRDIDPGDEGDISTGQRSPGRRLRERRRTRRYPLRLPIRYRTVENRSSGAGGGQTVDLSSRAVLFTTEGQPPIGSTVEAAVQWPVQVGDETPLQLIISGPVLRRDSRGVVALIKRFEFIRERSGPAAPGPEDFGAEGAEGWRAG